jgi:hypothetical protein
MKYANFKLIENCPGSPWPGGRSMQIRGGNDARGILLQHCPTASPTHEQCGTHAGPRSIPCGDATGAGTPLHQRQRSAAGIDCNLKAQNEFSFTHDYRTYSTYSFSYIVFLNLFF